MTPRESGLRQAGPEDLPTIVRLTLDAYAAHTARLGGPPLPVTEDYAPRIGRGEVWLLDDGAGEPAGLIVLEDAADHLLIHSVAVATARQGQGLGGRLLSFAEGLARTRGLGAIRLYTNPRMTGNIALYRRHGYRETGRRPNPRRPGWTLVDMAKDLGGP